MRIWTILLVLSVVALVALRAIAQIQNCCYGVQCPVSDDPDCILKMSEPSDWVCKRTCDPPCLQGNGCCQWRTRECTYIKKDEQADCPPAMVAIVETMWSRDKFCRRQGQGDQVGCLETAINVCLPY